jgi:hypothetical protein
MTISKKQRMPAAAAPTSPWLLLIHQLPPEPAYFRVKIWRRLQDLGAVSLKNSVYVLPSGDQTREDLQWLLREIERGAGESVICEAQLASGMTDPQMRRLFNDARDADYVKITEELRKLSTPPKRGAARRADPSTLKPQLAKLRRRLARASEIDFFGATGRLTAEALLAELEQRLVSRAPEINVADAATKTPVELVGKIWVTRRDVHVDRIACAWLIRRFIDSAARFKFVAAKDYSPKRDELRFDMFEAEFTHEGGRCTFEVLVERTGLDDAALRAIAEIVHDIDLKDGRFRREQVAGIAHVIDGICMTQADDLARVDRASTLFDDMYELFRRRRSR